MQAVGSKNDWRGHPILSHIHAPLHGSVVHSQIDLQQCLSNLLCDFFFHFVLKISKPVSSEVISDKMTCIYVQLSQV